MQPEVFVEVLSNALFLVIKLVSAIIIPSLMVGLIVAIFQAARRPSVRYQFVHADSTIEGRRASCAAGHYRVAAKRHGAVFGRCQRSWRLHRSHHRGSV